MRWCHVARLVEDVPKGELAALMSRGLLRDEPQVDQFLGLSQVLGHTFRAAVRSGSFRRLGGEVLLPTSLRTTDGARIGVVACHEMGVGRWDRHEFAGFSLEGEDDGDLWEEVERLPWEREATPDPGSTLTGPLWSQHLLAHPERLPGLDLQTAERRVRAALKVLARGGRAEERRLAPFWFEDRGRYRGWHYAAPLEVHGTHPLAAVLSPDSGGSLRVTTILPRHEAYWNVASTGRTPPSWLNLRTPGRAS